MGLKYWNTFAISIVFTAITCSRAFLSHNVVLRQTSVPWHKYPTCRASKEKWVNEREEKPLYRTRTTGDSAEAQELQNMRYKQDDEKVDIVREDYYYYEDDDDGDDEEEYVEDNNEVDEPTGNFWSNPKESFDSFPSERRQEPSKLEEATDLHPERRPRPRPRGKPKRKTTFRSGAPSTPEPVSDFYDRFFWYGFNPDESIAPGDKTLFGGTKGKFNGLDFFEDDERRRKPARRRKRPPQQFRADEWFDDIMDSLDNDYVDDDEFDTQSTRRRAEPGDERSTRQRKSLPPEETFYSYETDDFSGDDGDEEQEIVASETVRRRPTPGARSGRRRPRPPDDDYFDEDRNRRRKRDAYSARGRPTPKRKPGDSVSNEIASWFGPDDVDDEPERFEYYGRVRRPRRQRPPQQEDESWSFTNILDGIFGVNRDEVDMNAAMYNKQMGLDKPPRSQRRPERRRRPSGRVYPYEEERREPSPPSSYRREKEEEEEDLGARDVVDVDVVIEDEDDTRQSELKRERTIEERAAAFERVPPSGVPAWGPSGAVGIDARTKATLDALEEIREATRKVELKEEQVIEAKEDIVICKADFELQKKRLLANIDDREQVRSRLRQMKIGIQDAAHTLRRRRAELEVARDRLADLEDSNWALLSLYDADKAFQEVVETFREFEASEKLNAHLEDLNDTKSSNDSEKADIEPTDVSESRDDKETCSYL